MKFNNALDKILEKERRNLFDSWPEAVEQDLIVNSEQDKIERAKNVYQKYFPSDINGKVLDYGCGESFIVDIAAEKGFDFSVGYDINLNGSISGERTLLTNSPQEVLEKSPYDFILIYDVLDHDKDPVESLSFVKKLSKKDTKISLICHPWCSRHGGHLYKQINKAYIHLFVDEEFPQKVFYPLRTYQKWIDLAGFVVVKHQFQKDEIEPFFKENKLVSDYLKSFCFTETNETFPEFQMSMSFVEYELRIK